MNNSSTGDAGANLLQGANLLADENLEAFSAWFLNAARLQTALDSALKRDAGISLVDFNMLLALAEAPEHTLQMSQLAAQVAFSAPRLNYRVAQCEKAGWMRKTECSEDKRAHNIELTDAGLNTYVHAGAIHREQIRRVFDPALRPGDAHVITRVSSEVGRLLEGGV